MGSCYFVFVYVVMITKTVLSESNLIEGVCNWNASSGAKVIPASVFTVRFTACKTGRLVWRDPFGGVEVKLESSVPVTTSGTFKVCLTAKDAGTDIFVKIGSGLKRLRSHNDENFKPELCIRSKSKTILIYFESLDDTRTRSAEFWYRTSFQRNGSGLLRPRDCKMCDYKELVRSFCSGDFAVHGFVKTVLPIGGGKKRGEALVVAKQVLHQSFQIFQKAENTKEFKSNVNFPLYCHWKKRSKHGFLFTGSIQDGVGPVVKCRMKFSRWKRIYREDICKNISVET